MSDKIVSKSVCECELFISFLNANHNPGGTVPFFNHKKIHYLSRKSAQIRISEPDTYIRETFLLKSRNIGENEEFQMLYNWDY